MSEQENTPIPEGQAPQQPQVSGTPQNDPWNSKPIILDSPGQFNLWGAANWSMFIAIAILVLTGLMIIFYLYVGMIYSSYSRGIGISEIIIFLIMTAIYSVPAILLLNFAMSAKKAIRENSASLLNTAIQNLRRNFKFVGILLIISLVFYAIFAVFLVSGAIALFELIDPSKWMR